MIHDIMPGTEEQLAKEMTTAYVGIDPTADSLHIGHLVSVMILKHFQRCGHKPIFLVGGATGYDRRPLPASRSSATCSTSRRCRRNQEGIRRQLERLVDFSSDEPNAAELVNNYDWMKEFSFLEFIRDIGKCITVNYMMAKDSVKKRFNGEGEGMSFTEFTYQLVQGTDFLHLYQHKNCKLQMGGSDQWGNITTGTELIRRKTGGEAFALTCPLIKKADGTKFGKTESGNVWLDPRYTSPYKFYQFWLNVSDEDAERYVKIFTMLDRETIEGLVAAHREAPHLRGLQKALAREVTCMVHGEEEYRRAVEASEILFGGATAEALRGIDEQTFLQVFEGVPRFEISRPLIEGGVGFLALCTEHAAVFPSKGEARKLIQGGGVSLNKRKIAAVDCMVGSADLLSGRYLLVQKGKKNYYLIVVTD